MPVRVEWDNPDKTVIRYEMQGDWNWNEFRPAYNQAKVMLAEVPHEVNFILDLRGSGGIPSGVLLRLRGIYSERVPNAGMTVIIGASGFVQALHSVVRRMYPAIAERYVYALGGGSANAPRRTRKAKGAVTEARERRLNGCSQAGQIYRTM